MSAAAECDFVFSEPTSSKGGFHVRHYDLLNWALWGTKGHTLVRVPQVQDVLEPNGTPVGEARFYAIEEISKPEFPDPASVYVTQTKQVAIGRGSYRATHGSFLATHPKYQGRKLARRLVEQVLAENQENADLHYVFIEGDNYASQAVFEKLGFTQLRNFKISQYGKLKPQQSESVHQALESDRQQIIGLLASTHRGLQLADYPSSLDITQYWVLRDESGKIIAGVQAVPQFYEVKNLPIPFGLGPALLGLISKTPVLNSLFNPAGYRHVKFGNFAVQGNVTVAQIEELLDTVLAQKRLKTGMLWMDEEDPLRKLLQGSLSPVNGLVQTPMQLWGRWLGSEDQQEAVFTELSDQPMTVSPQDN